MGKTIAEKIFDAHLRDAPFPGTMVLDIDRVFCHEITTPVAVCDLEARARTGYSTPTRSRRSSTT